MPDDGSNVYSLPAATLADAVSGTTISSADYKAGLEDIEAALNNRLHKNGGTMSGNLVVSGTATFSDAATFQGAATFSDAATFEGTATFEDAATFEGDVTLPDTSTIVDPADSTKAVRLDAGAVTAGQTRVITVPDADVSLQGLQGIKLTGVSARTQIIPSGSTTQLTDWTPSGELDDASFSSGRLTVGPNTAGIWGFTLHVGAQSATLTQALAVKNNDPVGNMALVINGGTAAVLSGFFDLEDGDTLDFRLFHNNGGTATNGFTNGDGGAFTLFRLPGSFS